MLRKDRCKTTAGFFVIPLLSQLWEEKNYCEKRNELSSWRPVALPNRHIHLYLFKLGYDVHALLSSVMYILSGENITAMFTISRRRWDQNTTQVANRLDRARAAWLHTYGCSMFLHGSEHQAGYRRSIVADHLIYQPGFPNEFSDWMRRITRKRIFGNTIGLTYCLPAYVSWRAVTTTLCHSWLYPPVRD